MATRRRIGVSTATTEAARRQLMQPVPCWEKTWVLSENTTTGTSLKVLKWVKTEKIQQFSDEEGEVDEPLAPLPDEPEGDEEIDLDEPVTAADVTPLGGEDDVKESQELLSKPHSPQPQLSMSLDPSSVLPVEEANALDISLHPFEVDDTMGDVVDVGQKLNPEDMIGLDMSALAPDDTDFVGNLEEILAVSMMDQTVDPFAQQVEE